MKTTISAVVGLLLMVTPVSAHGDGAGFGAFGDFGGLGLGGLGFGEHHGGFDGLGGFGGGLGFDFFNVDRIQTRFENRFDTLQTQYDDGVATGDDFFTSEKYDLIIDKTELLTDSYGLFASGVERSIDRLGDFISTTNDDLTYFNDLLAQYQADDSLSAARLERIETWIGRVTDRLSNKLDSLTETQTTLQTNLPTYQSFQTDLSTFLTDITAAGGATDASSSSLKSLASLATTRLAATESSGSMCESTQLGLSSGAVPEPSGAALVLLASGAMMVTLRRRG